MSTMSMLHALKNELKSNECDALLQILDRLGNGGNTIYGTHSYLAAIEKQHQVSIEDIKTKISGLGTPYKVSQNRIGKDLDLL